MGRPAGPKPAKVRGKNSKAQFSLGLAGIVSETVQLWRKHHLAYDQTKYVVEQARRHLKLRPPGTRRRTVDRLDKSDGGFAGIRAGSADQGHQGSDAL